MNSLYSSGKYPILPFHRPPAQAVCPALLLASALILAAGCATQGARTSHALDYLPATGLEQHQTIEMRLRRAQEAVIALHPDVALEALKAPPEADAPVGVNLAYHQLRAEAYALAGNHLESARERVWMDPLLEDTRSRRNNQLAIWETLARLSDPALRRLSSAGEINVLSGWMELVQVSRQYRQQPELLRRNISRWSQRYPGHPAAEGLLREFLDQLKETSPPTGSVALLLPLSGHHAAAGTAVRDGFLAASLRPEAGKQHPIVRIYDVGGGPQTVADQYRQAVQDGAEMVVGPLERDSVAQLIREGRLSVPVLALNYSDERSRLPRAMHQFGLAPEDEARQAAWRARLDNHERGIAIVPAGPWGERVLNAFREQWNELGGFLLETTVYDPTQTDFAEPLRQVLNIDASRQRKKDLVRTINREIEFEPRRRQDVDFIFLVAFPKLARLIQPQLRFYQASNLPVYATSHVYSGVPDQKSDRDMNGIRFCDMPWILGAEGSWTELRRDLAKLWPQNTQRHSRLYALGVDAYNILPFLDKRGEGAFSRFSGVTGNLYVDEKRRVHRELTWARFRNGLPKPLTRASR